MKCPLCEGEGGYSEGLGIPYGECSLCRGKGRVWFGKRIWWWFIDTMLFTHIMRLSAKPAQTQESGG